MFLREKYFVLEYCEAQLLQPMFASISLSAAGDCRFNILVTDVSPVVQFLCDPAQHTKADENQ